MQFRTFQESLGKRLSLIWLVLSKDIEMKITIGSKKKKKYLMQYNINNAQFACVPFLLQLIMFMDFLPS